MARQERKAHQQQEQVREDGPFVRQVPAEPGEAMAGLESSVSKLIGGDDGKARERDRQRMAVEQRHAKQHQREQDEIDGDAQHQYGFSLGARRRTSVSGHDQSFVDVASMSGLLPKAAVERTTMDGRKVPEGDICSAAQHNRRYSTTSSAATGSLWGTVRPGILAVAALMTSSNFDASCAPDADRAAIPVGSLGIACWGTNLGWRLHGPYPGLEVG